MPTLTVFWEGTANTLNPPTTQIGLFAAATMAIDITHEGGLPYRRETSLRSPPRDHFKMAFDGCAVTNGMLGLLFAVGLRQQARRVKTRIEQLLAAYGQTVKCNVLGLSRGGVAAIFLAQALECYDKTAVELNLLLFDPVPGDQTWSGFPYTGSFAKDLSNCASLRRVLAVYPHEPLPDITFHAPLLCAYPRECDVEEDVTLGCHQGALFATRRSTHTVHRASNLSFRRIVNFFEEVGTPLDLDSYFSYQPTDTDCLAICREALAKNQATRRKPHDGTARGRLLVRRSVGLFLNKYHKALESKHEDHIDDRIFRETFRKPQFMLDIECPDAQRACF
ncbi:hypothetical protein CTAYLR_007881 [Chrysophaeum taylorii]|uniref:DUF2235 domain-containing protein n=1 Tax=Chrysophaeum taylorii TaxID=2483200 RepID=A0AAD7XTB1_9STRA|nr:hypothetical protein CTAYLR_007881 [Chrysophaeum taylorii]